MLEGAATDAVGWIDPDLSLSDDAVSALREALAVPDVAAATLRGYGQTLTVLGVPQVLPAFSVRQVLYAPAGLAVYHRARVLETGGIDASLVFGHEDANLGWRLALRGLRTVEVSAATPPMPPTAIRAGSSPDRVGLATRLRHQTANEIATLYVCAGTEWLRAALPCALARLICLAAADAGLAPEQFDFGRHIPDTLPLPVETLARLLAVEDLIRHLPALHRQRALEQGARTRPDEDIRGVFAADPVDAQWLDSAGEGARALCRMLGVDMGRPGTKTGSDRDKAGAPTDNVLRALASDAPAPPPRVSFIVLTASGPTHLPDCLDSLAALDYPREAVEVIVVDNGSADDPRSVIAHHYPSARVIRNDRNLGFCGGNNVGVNAASHEWLFFLNDDTRVDPALLRAVFETAARRQAVSVGAFVVDWSGTRVDYGGGGVNFDGHGFQHGVGSARLEDFARERPVAFANGAAMLIRRDAYLASGGFPVPYFAYYEDVALGWALWLQGHQVWLCPRGIVYHRHHGTSAQSASAARRRNLERNACFTILTHGSNEALPDLLAASLLLAAERVLLAAGLGGLVEDRLTLGTDHQPRRADGHDLRLYMAHLRTELLRRGGRREHGALGSLARVGLRGLVGTSVSLYRLWGQDRAPTPTLPRATHVDTSADWASTLAAVWEWCRRAGEIEPLRRALQDSRQQTEYEFAFGVAENWLNSLPVEPARQAEYEGVHRAVVAEFDLGRFVRAR